MRYDSCKVSRRYNSIHYTNCLIIDMAQTPTAFDTTVLVDLDSDNGK